MELIKGFLEWVGIPSHYQFPTLLGIIIIGAVWAFLMKWNNHRLQRDLRFISTQFVYIYKEGEQWFLRWTAGEMIRVADMPGLLPGRVVDAAAQTKTGNPALTLAYAADHKLFMNYVVAAIQGLAGFLLQTRSIIQLYKLEGKTFLVMIVCEKYFGIPIMMKTFVIAESHLMMFLCTTFRENVRNGLLDPLHADRIATLQRMAEIHFYHDGRMKQTWRTWWQWLWWYKPQMLEVIREVPLLTAPAVTAEEIAAALLKGDQGSHGGTLKERLAACQGSSV